MNQTKTRTVVAVLADVPLWTLPGLEALHTPGHYATWLEPLVAEFECEDDLEIHWISVSKRVQKPQRHVIHGQTIHILPRKKKSVSMFTGYYSEIMQIRKLLGTIRPSVVHAWGSEDVYGLAAAFGGIGKRIFTLQGCLSDYLKLLGGNLYFRVQTAYEKPTIRKFSIGTAESPLAVDSLRRIKPDMDIRLLDYGVNLEFHSATWNPAPEPVIAFVGGITERKGIVDLIEATQSSELSHISFKIIGEGELLNSLRKKAKPNVDFVGKCNRSEVVEILSSAWCLTIPTYADTGPTVIKEARVVGLPVVTTTGAGASAYIENGKSGFIINPGDVREMRNAILNVCSSRDNCTKMGRHGWEEMRQLLHPRTTAKKIASLYRELSQQ